MCALLELCSSEAACACVTLVSKHNYEVDELWAGKLHAYFQRRGWHFAPRKNFRGFGETGILWGTCSFWGHTVRVR